MRLQAMYNVHQQWQHAKTSTRGRSLAATPTAAPTGSGACDKRAAVACVGLALGFYQDVQGGCLTFFACFSGVSQCAPLPQSSHV